MRFSYVSIVLIGLISHSSLIWTMENDTFTFERETEGYALTVQINEGESLVEKDQSTKVLFKPLNSTTLSEDRDYHKFVIMCENMCKKSKTPSVVDLCPINIVVRKGKGSEHRNEVRTKKNLEKTLIESSKERKELEAQGAYINASQSSSSASNSLRLFVLDTKDENERYIDSAQIGLYEDYAQFILNKATAGFADPDQGLNFFIKEGSLKARLRKVLTQNTTDLFDGNDYEGTQLFCMLCEFIMNGFKTGYVAQVNKQELHPRDFFAYFGKKPTFSETEFVDHLHGLPLITVYSKKYEETYSKKSAYYTGLCTFFDSKHEFVEKDGITVITVKKKEE